MKRVITAAINKRAALEALADYERTIYQSPMYSVGVNLGRNIVEVYDRNNNLVLEVVPDVEPVEVTRYKFVKATPEQIAKGQGLYVREKYTASTQKQISKPSSEISVANTY